MHQRRGGVRGPAGAGQAPGARTQLALHLLEGGRPCPRAPAARSPSARPLTRVTRSSTVPPIDERGDERAGRRGRHAPPLAAGRRPPLATAAPTPSRRRGNRAGHLLGAPVASGPGSFGPHAQATRPARARGGRVRPASPPAPPCAGAERTETRRGRPGHPRPTSSGGATRRVREYTARFDGVELGDGDLRVAPARAARRPRRPRRPTCGTRSRRRPPPSAASTPASCPRRTTTSGAAYQRPGAAPARSTGPALRARRPGRLPVHGPHDRHPRPGRRRARDRPVRAARSDRPAGSPPPPWPPPPWPASTSVHPIGGAQAIAALAFGTASIRPVDVIVGPGNAYVARGQARGGRAGPRGHPVQLRRTRPRSSSSPTTPCPPTTPPSTWPCRPSTGRAASRGCSPGRKRSADDVEAELDPAGRGGAPPGRHPGHAGRQRLRRAVRRSRSRPSPSPTSSPPSTSSCCAPPPEALVDRRPPRRRRLLRAARARPPSATTWPARTTCCPRSARPASQAP